MRGSEPLLLMLLLVPVAAAGKDKDNGRRPCATTYSVIQEDKLGNVQQGLSNPKNLKWADKDLEKKYPDVCYVPPAPSVKTVFVITVTPATYHGTRVETETNTTPTSGTVYDNSGQEVGTYEGTQTTTSSTAVPYSFEYGRFMLTVETFGLDGKPVVRRRFQQNGIYRTMYGVPLGGRGHHPTKALIEDAVKWIHAGGLEDPLQSVVSGKADVIGVIEQNHAPTILPNMSESEKTARAPLPGASTQQRTAQGTIGVSCDGNPLLRHDGVVVSQVVAGGPADQVGIKAGDVILAIDDHYLYTIEELNSLIARCKPGSAIRVHYRRYAISYETPVVVSANAGEVTDAQH